MNESGRIPVVLAGWYGATNLGDELLLEMFVRWVRDAGGMPTVISLHPHYTARQHGVPAVGYADLPAIVEAIAEAKLVVLGGGGLFQDYEPVPASSLERFPALNVAQYAQFAFLARDLGVPVAALAQGVGPLASADARGIAREVFELADVVSVRDARSAALLAELAVRRHVHVAPDAAWAYAVPRRTSQPLGARFPALANRKVFAMVLRDWPFAADWEDAFVAAYASSVPDDWACLWLDFSRLPDEGGTSPRNREIAARLAPRLPGRHAIWDGMALDEAASLIAACDAMIAMRLHGALLGHLCGLPVVALEYDDKVSALGDEAGIPSRLRLALPDIPLELPAAIRSVAAGEPDGRIALHVRDRLAGAALAHAALLQDAMRAAARRPLVVPEPLWLLRWSAQHDAAARTRIESALSRRNMRA